MRALAATVGAHSSTRRRQSSVLAVLICTALAFLTPNVALTGHEAPDDSSVFAYIGWLMHRGYVPYRDVWDHKGPLLYELNYLGWLISPDSTIGIGLLQAAIYLVCFYLLWRILDGLGVPQVPIYISLFFAMTCLAQVGQGSNMAETWAIAAIAISHWVAYRALSGGVRAHHAVLLGLSFAACFWIRPNLCVVPGFAILFAREASRRQRGPINGLFFLVSTGIAAAVTSAFVLAPVWLSSASNQFRAQYFAYNSAYTRAISWQGHWFGFLDLLAVPKSMALFYGGALGWLALLFRVRHMALPDSYRAFLLLTLPFEILAA
ncbi:MAG: hypothetical protein JO061_09865, partial [Acidobacteriaceae bacterium]|nr:hypothetical protein [Acidobacteriaceae bacterium]